jgi:hypothetical protein
MMSRKSRMAARAYARARRDEIERNEAMMQTSRTDDAILNQMLNGNDDTAIVYHPRAGWVPLWTARALDKSAINDAEYPPPPHGVEPAPDAERVAAMFGPIVRNGGDCSDGEERDLRALDLDERRDEEPPEEAQVDVQRLYELVARTAARFGRFLDELSDLRKICAGLRQQNAELSELLLARGELEKPAAEDPPPMLN